MTVTKDTEFDPEILSQSDWCLIKVPSKYREKVRRLFLENAPDDLVGVCLVPRQLVMKPGTSKPTSTILYPNYLVYAGKYDTLVSEIFEHVFQQLRLKMPSPIALSFDEIQTLREHLKPAEDADEVRLQLEYTVGDVVEMHTGAFAGFKGSVESINHRKQTVRLQLSIFGRKTLAEVSAQELIRVS